MILRTADATRAAEIYAGRFVFCRQDRDLPWALDLRSRAAVEDWEVALLGFGWLRHLRAADTALTRANARSLVDDWNFESRCNRRAVGAPRRCHWRAASYRCYRRRHWCSAIPTANSIDANLRGLSREIRYLRYSMLDIPDGVPRLQVLIALCYASLCLANQARHIAPPPASSPMNCSGKFFPTAAISRAIPAR